MTQLRFDTFIKCPQRKGPYEELIILPFRLLYCVNVGVSKLTNLVDQIDKHSMLNLNWKC